MSVRPGTVQTIIRAAAAIGVSTGAVIALNNQFAVVPAAFISYVASGTAGSRTVVVQLLDSLGNILMQTAATTAITTGQTPKLILMSGQTYLNIASPISQVLPWPAEMPAPVGASLRVVDTSNIDVADTVAANISFAT
jgi:hypothetical protein